MKLTVANRKCLCLLRFFGKAPSATAELLDSNWTVEMQ